MRTLIIILALLLASPAHADAPPQVSGEIEFANRFIPVFVSGYMALRRGDKSQAQRAVSAGRLQNFRRDLTSPLGGLTMEIPGLNGEHTFRWLWTALEESVDPRRDFS